MTRSTRLSGSASSTTSRGSRFTETEVAVNPYSNSGAPKPRARPTRVKSKRDTLRSGLSLRELPSLTEQSARGADQGEDQKCVPASIPRFADMLMSSSASRARIGGWLSVDDAAVMASTDPAARGSMSGALARFWRALCVGDYESARGNGVSLSRARGTSLAVASLPRTSRDDGSGDVDDTSARELHGLDTVGQFGAARLARYKPSNQLGGRFDSRSESDGVSETTDDDDGDGDRYDSEDDDDDEENASRDEASAPVTVTVAASSVSARRRWFDSARVAARRSG